MKEIQKCNICEPDVCLDNGRSGKLYYSASADTYYGNPQQIADCPILRKKIVIEEKEDLMKPKLINWRTGETYDKL